MFAAVTVPVFATVIVCIVCTVCYSMYTLL